MDALIEVILPVFLVIGFGYAAALFKLISPAQIDAVMAFAQKFAVPVLLFTAIASLDLGQEFQASLLISFYVGAFCGFFAGLMGARILFRRPWEDSIAIGFASMFSNSVLLGLPIAERAYGAASLEANYAIIAIHAPLVYAVGVSSMEIARNRSGSLIMAVPRIFNAMFKNALVMGIALGLVVNLSGISLPVSVNDALDLVGRAALPTALFGLGGVLARYRPEGDILIAIYICAVALILHPAITFLLAKGFGLGTDALRSAVLTAAMPTGVNAFIFATLYGVAKRVTATAVLLGTALSIVTAWLWIGILP